MILSGTFIYTKKTPPFFWAESDESGLKNFPMESSDPHSSVSCDKETHTHTHTHKRERLVRNRINYYVTGQ